MNAAELDYDRITRPPGVTLADINADLLGLQTIAMSVINTAKLAWTMRPSSEVVGAVRFDLALAAECMADSLADDLGLSREAARLLTAYVREYAANEGRA